MLILLFFIGKGICSDDLIVDQISSLKKEILQTDFSAVDQLYQMEMKNLKSMLEQYAKEEDLTIDEVTKEDVAEKKPSVKFGPFLAVLKKDTVVTDVETENLFMIYQNINVLAVQAGIGSRYSFILDKKGNRRFIVKNALLTSLNDDLNLSLGKNPDISYVKPVDFQVIDHVFPIESIFTIHSEVISSSYFENLYRQELEKNFNISRTEMKLFYPWIFPIRLGFSFSYQSDEWQTEEDSIFWRGFFVGPTLYFTLMKHSKLDFNFHLGFFKSLFMESEFRNAYYKLSSNVFQLELAARFLLSEGYLVAGSSFRHQRPSIKEGSANFTLDPYRDTLSSISLFVGYGFNFKL